MKMAELKKMSRKELERLKSDVEKVLEQISQRDKKEAIAAAEKAALAHGFSLAELSDVALPKKRGPKPGKPKSPSVAKYANPADRTQTWTGKGRKPDWFKQEIAKGTAPEAMAV